MQINLKRKINHEKPGTLLMHIPAGTYIASLDRANKNQLLIFTDDEATCAVRVQDIAPISLPEDEELFNIIKVNLTGVNLEEV